MSNRREHPLFVAHPIDGTVALGGVSEPTPYHLYDGTLLLVGGSVDGAEATRLLQPQGLLPLLDSDGRALAALWLGDFTEASLGPHHELQLSLLTTRTTAASAVTAHPFATLKALARRDVLMVCQRLWNNTERVVRYNREHLHLGAALTHSAITWGDPIAFRCVGEDGAAIASGALAPGRTQHAGPLWRAMLHLGWSGMAAGFRSPFLEVGVVNTLGAHATQTELAMTWSKPDRVVVRDISAVDHIELHGDLSALRFVPGFVEHMTGVRFVYSRPKPLDATVSSDETIIGSPR
jgi:hypothetical protein